MTALIPLIVHLPQAVYVGQIRLDRFSPNFDEAERFGLTKVRPLPAYRYVFPLPDEQVAGLAYFFTFGYRDGRDPQHYTQELRRETMRWLRFATAAPRRRPRLDLHDGETVAVIEDTRACAVQAIHVLRGLRRALYLQCDIAHSAETLARTLGLSLGTVTRALRHLVRAKLMIERDGRYLSLAVFRSRNGAVPEPVRPRNSTTLAAASP
jgi:magnesium-protoporphyrin IX monomethyl ester (oxidative) cyclase